MLILRILITPLWILLFGVLAIAAAFGARRTDDADPHAIIAQQPHPLDYDVRMR